MILLVTALTKETYFSDQEKTLEIYSISSYKARGYYFFVRAFHSKVRVHKSAGIIRGRVFYVEIRYSNSERLQVIYRLPMLSCSFFSSHKIIIHFSASWTESLLCLVCCTFQSQLIKIFPKVTVSLSQFDGLTLFQSNFFVKKFQIFFCFLNSKSNEYFMILFEKPSILNYCCSLQVVESWVNMVDPTTPQCAPRPYPVWLRLFRVRVQGNPKISIPQKTLFLQ